MKRARIVFWLGVVGLALWTTLLEPLLLLDRSYTLQLQQPFPELRVAVLTDLHLGAPQQRLRYLDRIVDQTRALDPDMVLMAGDYFYEYLLATRYPPSVLTAPLRRLRPRYGVYAVLGNHDYNMQPKQIRQALEAAGVVVLENESAFVAGPGKSGIWVVGLADLVTAGAEPQRAFAGVPPDAPVLVLSHTPDVFPLLDKYRFALGVAGHLHGGQINIPGYGPPYLPSQYDRRFFDRHVREGLRDYFMAPGTGMSVLPMRFNAPPEISLLLLRG